LNLDLHLIIIIIIIIIISTNYENIVLLHNLFIGKIKVYDYLEKKRRFCQSIKESQPTPYGRARSKRTEKRAPSLSYLQLPLPS